jgi:hypothetical protein
MTYTVAVTGMTGGIVEASIAADVAHDAAGNPNTEATSDDNSVTGDYEQPTVTINQAVGQADPTIASPINFTVVFSEPVLDFATGDVSFTGSTDTGTLVGTVTDSGDHMTYTVAVTGMTGGIVKASIEIGVAHDAAGNPNTESTSDDDSVTFQLS